MLAALPNAELIIEDELHFLSECKRYEDLRVEQSPDLQHLLKDNIATLFDQRHVMETSNYIYKLFKERFELT